MQKYSFYIISNDHAIDQNGNQTINENIKKSKIMIIGQSKNLNKETNDEYIILSFELTIILLKISHVTYLTSLFSANPKIFVCFLDKVKEDVHFEARGIEDMPNYSYFQIEITNFKKEIALIARYYEFNQIFDIIMPYISGYLI